MSIHTCSAYAMRQISYKKAINFDAIIVSWLKFKILPQVNYTRYKEHGLDCHCLDCQHCLDCHPKNISSNSSLLVNLRY